MKLASRFAKHSSELRSDTGLTHDQMRSVAPSIYAAAAHESRSARYTYVPTSIVLNGLLEQDFHPVMVAQSRCRVEGKRDFTKHLVRLRKGVNNVVGKEVPEIILLNSHDGTTSYQMLAGMFRFVCLNGMVCGDGEEIRVHHKGDIVSNVIEGAFAVVKNFDRALGSVDSMKQIALNPSEQNAFARASLVAKYGEQPAYPVTEAQVLEVRRSEDRGADLWSTFNRAQEALVRGGLESRSATNRRTRTRAITGITQNVALNRALWTLADEMAKIKIAA